MSQIPFLMHDFPRQRTHCASRIAHGVDYFIPKPLHIGNTVAIV